MTILQAIVLGAIQGITEFLPVSSSGHLIFLPQLFGWEDQGIMFDVFVHAGTLLAVVFFSRKRIVEMLKACFTKKGNKSNKRLAFAIAISIIPVVILGLIFETNARSALIIGISFYCMGNSTWNYGSNVHF